MNLIKKIKLKRFAFLLSILIFIFWALLGTGASLAWFNDSSNELKNVFHVAEFDLEVSHRLDDGTWEEVVAETELFDKEALYEPGYTQIIYLRVRNNGDIPFDWKTAVSVYDYVPGINVFGSSFNLQEYLKFGVVYADTEAELDGLLATRSQTRAIATEDLNVYSSTEMELLPDSETFFAIVVRMPEEVTNVANYKVPHQPKVYMGVIVSASQQNK